MDSTDQVIQIITNFGASGVLLLWLWDTRQRLKDKEVELQESRNETKQARDRHESDLRDWSGIDPKFNTWAKVNAESDTKLRLRMEERERLREHVNKLEPPQ